MPRVRCVAGDNKYLNTVLGYVACLKKNKTIGGFVRREPTARTPVVLVLLVHTLILLWCLES